jgi:hypothetical protein
MPYIIWNPLYHEPPKRQFSSLKQAVRVRGIMLDSIPTPITLHIAEVLSEEQIAAELAEEATVEHD